MGLLRKPVRPTKGRGEDPVFRRRGRRVRRRLVAPRVAIFHLDHRAIGKATHRAGFAAAHVKYILRDRAATQVLGDLPGAALTRNDAARWLTEREQKVRANGRVADRLVLALPDVSIDEAFLVHGIQGGLALGGAQRQRRRAAIPLLGFTLNRSLCIASLLSWNHRALQQFGRRIGDGGSIKERWS